MLLDSMPGARENAYGSEQTYEILSLLERLPASFAKRELFLERVIAEGQSKMIAEWLAMNLERTEEGFRLRPRHDRDQSAAQRLLQARPVARARRLTRTRGCRARGRSAVWRPEDRARFTRLSSAHPRQFRLHVSPKLDTGSTSTTSRVSAPP